jgi:hypothetical protein
MKKKLSKLKKRPNFGPPSWKKDNSLANLKKYYPNAKPKMLKQFLTENSKLEKFLVKNGWKYWDSCNIWEHGFTLTFVKKKDGTQKRNMYFSWYWDNQGGDEFYFAEMRNYCELYPRDELSTPGLTAEIRYITARHIKDIAKFEDALFRAVAYQAPIPE